MANQSIIFESDPLCNCTIRNKLCPDRSSAVFIWKTVPSILLLIGTIGNILSICVLRSPSIRKSVCSIYLIALSVSDLLVLYTGLVRYWIIGIFAFDVRDLSSVTCKLYSFFTYYLLDVSSWILVAITMERFFLVWFPFSKAAKCNKKVAVTTLILIAVSLFLVNSHILYGRDIDVKYLNGSTIGKQKCLYISDNYEHFFQMVWPSIDFIVFSGIPFICLFTGNLLIFFKVVISKRASRRQVAPTRNENSINKQNSPRFSSMTVILITINTVFLVCNTPISVYFIVRGIWKRDSNVFICAKLYLIQSVCNCLMFLNNSINFLLYILSGSRFRKAFVAMFTKMKPQPPIPERRENPIALQNLANNYPENNLRLQIPWEEHHQAICQHNLSQRGSHLRLRSLSSQESDSRSDNENSKSAQITIFHIEQTDEARPSTLEAQSLC